MSVILLDRGATAPSLHGARWRALATLLAGAVTGLCRVAQRHQRLARDAQALSQMDDRLLRDIGLTRFEIDTMVRGVPRRR